MQRAWSVPGKPLEVKGLRDDALPGDEASPWMRTGSATDGSWRPAPDERSVCSARANPPRPGPLPEVAGIGHEGDRDVSRLRMPNTFRAEVVLHVARAAFGTAHNGCCRPLALELLEDRFVRLAERMREHTQATAVRHPEDDLVGAVTRRKLDRLVEHWHKHVEPFDRELLLPEERTAKVLLERLHAREALEQEPLLVSGERLPKLAGLDHRRSHTRS